MTQERR